MHVTVVLGSSYRPVRQGRCLYLTFETSGLAAEYGEARKMEEFGGGREGHTGAYGAQAFGGSGARAPGMLSPSSVLPHHKVGGEYGGLREGWKRSRAASRCSLVRGEACCEVIWGRRCNFSLRSQCSRLKITVKQLYREVLMTIMQTTNFIEHESRLPLAVKMMHGWRLQSWRLR